MLAGGTLAACGSGATTAASSTTSTPVTSPEDALSRLKAGNARFVSGHPTNQGRDSVRRAELAHSQSPFAVVLGCSDSRVVPEVLFDQGIGDLFVVRVAGNTATTPILVGSIEYAIAELGSVLVVVLGHQECGAVKAALANVTKGKTSPGDIPAVIEPILPAARLATSAPGGQQLGFAVEENVRMQVQDLPSNSNIVQSAVLSGKLKVVGAVYELVSGQVSFLSGAAPPTPTSSTPPSSTTTKPSTTTTHPSTTTTKPAPPTSSTTSSTTTSSTTTTTSPTTTTST